VSETFLARSAISIQNKKTDRRSDSARYTSYNELRVRRAVKTATERAQDGQ